MVPPLIYIKPFYKPILIGQATQWADPNDYVGRGTYIVGPTVQTFSTLEAAYANLQQYVAANMGACELQYLLHVDTSAGQDYLYYAIQTPNVGQWTIDGHPGTDGLYSCNTFRTVYGAMPQDDKVAFFWGSGGTGLYRVWYSATNPCYITLPTCWQNNINNCTGYPYPTQPGCTGSYPVLAKSVVHWIRTPHV